MIITFALNTATAKLAVDPMHAELPDGSFHLYGHAVFECSGLLDATTHRLLIKAAPAVVDGVRMYRLLMAGLEGWLRPLPVHNDGTRLYTGRLGPDDDFQIIGWPRPAIEDQPQHIQLFIVASRFVSQRAPAQSQSPAAPPFLEV